MDSFSDNEPANKKARIDVETDSAEKAEIFELESVIEIATSNFAVEKTADLVDVFD